MPKKKSSKVSTETKPESTIKQQNLPKKTRDVDLKRKKPETEKSGEPSNCPKKATPKKSDEIDEIFAALKRRKTEQAKADKSGDTKDKLKIKKKSKLANESGTSNTNPNPRRRTNDGFVIYSADELGINKKDAGQTPLCPFDCSCCF
ncbi:hypothetical protein KSS87_022822 [Heliosperma pusillum]|nr:hypothetical protein KSS87_022822 [Heliosperma pusillum]